MPINPQSVEWREIKSHIDERIAQLHVDMERFQPERELYVAQGAISELRRLLELVEKPAPTLAKGPDYSLRK